MEIEIIKFLQSFRTEFLDFFFKGISILGSFWGFLIILVCLYLFYDTIYATFFGVSYGLIWGFNQLIKVIVDRPRPYLASTEVINVFSASGSSFPSGHTTSIVVISLYLLFLIWSKEKRKYKIFKTKPLKLSKTLKIIFTILILLFATLVMISRMYLGQHYLSDILVALLHSSLLATLTLFIYTKREKIYLYFKGRKK